MTNSVNSYPVSQRQPFATGEAIIQELSLYPKSKALLDDARKELQENGLPNLEIRLEQTTSGHEANVNGNIITILPSLSAPLQLENAVFELHNVLSYKRHQELWDAAINGHCKSAEEYAKAKEYIEFDGKISCMNQITREINQLKKCESNSPYIEDSFEQLPDNMEFDQYYKLTPEDHKKFYREQWRSVNPRWKNCSKIIDVPIACAAIAAIAILVLSNMNII